MFNNNKLIETKGKNCFKKSARFVLKICFLENSCAGRSDKSNKKASDQSTAVGPNTATMFEGWILALLNKVLGEYVKDHCLARDRLKADVYNGHICLERLELRESAFDFLNLPVTLLKGYIGQVEVKISGGSWTNIMSKPIELWLDNIHILLGPKFEWDEEEREAREQQIKQALLRRAELFARHHDGSDGNGGGEEREGDSFLNNLLTKLVDNLEFHVRNVHVRYEDHVSHIEHPFAFGATLHSLHVKSTNELYQETYVNRVDDTEARRAIFKSFQMSKFSVYSNLIEDDDTLRGVNLDSVTFEKWQEIFSAHVTKDEPPLTSSLSSTGGGGGALSSSLSSLSSSSVSSSSSSSSSSAGGVSLDCCDEPPPDMHFVIKPLDIDIRVRVNRDPFDLSSPRLRLVCNVEKMSLVLEKVQYRSLLFLMSSFESQRKRDRYRRYRPRSATVTQDPKAWWLYAVNSVSMDLKEER